MIDQGIVHCVERGFYGMDEAFVEWRLMKAKEIGANTHESHGYSMYFDLNF